jgi:predicted RecB family endonuclease
MGRVSCMCVLCRNKEEVSVEKLGEATVVVFGSPRDKFSTTEVRDTSLELELLLMQDYCLASTVDLYEAEVWLCVAVFVCQIVRVVEGLCGQWRVSATTTRGGGGGTAR